MTCQSMGQLRVRMERIFGDQFSLELVMEDIPEMLWKGNEVH